MQVKMMIICPFWGQKGNVGLFRVERFVRWLHDQNYEIHIVNAGWSDTVVRTTFGSVITVADPLRIYPDPANVSSTGPENIGVTRKPNRFRRWLAYAILLPDLHILWAKSVIKSLEVRAIAKNCRFFMASSPPESSFIAAQKFADMYQGKFIMDMRDGWLDEPMKPLLRAHGWQRFRENLIEKKMVMSASVIQVTSNTWKQMLKQRYPGIASKIHVIPNVYPDSTKHESSTDSSKTDAFRLVHAGRISSSRPERNPDFLLSNLFELLKRSKQRVEFNFIGDLTHDEINSIKKWTQKFESIQSSILFSGQKSRAEVLLDLNRADGLLMISNSRASIPAKYFDYAITGKPVLCDTIQDSALQDACKEQTTFHLIIRDNEQNESVLDAFLSDLRSQNRNEPKLDPRFEESTVKQKFLEQIELLHD